MDDEKLPQDQKPPTTAVRRANPRWWLRSESGVILLLAASIVCFAILSNNKALFSGPGIIRWMVSSAEFALVAVPASLLISARRFDLSIGSIIGFSGMVIAWLSVVAGYPVWFAIGAALVLAVGIGCANGLLIAISGIPSIVVTLGSLFVLRGLTTLIAVLSTGRVVIGGVREAAAGDRISLAFGGEMLQPVFSWFAAQGWIGIYEAGHRAGQPIVSGIPMIVIWALIMAVGAHVLVRRLGTGKPLLLFMFAALCAAVVAACQVNAFGSAATDRGEFAAMEAIAAAFIGGAVLGGGRASVPGALLAAILFGLVREGVLYGGGEAALFHVIIGALLLPAIAINRFVQRLRPD